MRLKVYCHFGIYTHNVFGPYERTFLNSQYEKYPRWERLVN